MKNKFIIYNRTKKKDKINNYNNDINNKNKYNNVNSNRSNNYYNSYDSKISLLSIMSFILIILLISIPQASSLGITPGRTTLDYEPGLETEIAFSILNNEHKNMQVLLTLQGELNDSITLFDSLVEFMPSESSKSFRYKVRLPERIAKDPGLHTAEIVALEIPKASAQGTYVGATLAVVSQLYVYVPCPGKCVDVDLNVLDAEQNGTATFIVPVISRGQLGIGEVRAIIDIYTSLNEKITTIETDAYPLEPGARTELSAKWFVDVNQGDYLAKVSVFYDGESKSFEKQFAIGTKLLSIESILVNNFQLGEIAKLQILVENRWGQELKGVFANLLVYNPAGQTMADVKSATEDIPALAKKELIAYWDTVGVSEGEYDGKLMVKYGKKSSDKNLILKISENSLDITGVGYAIRPRGGKGINITTILLVLVIILLIVNLAWFVFFKRFIGKKKSKTSAGKIIRAK